MRVFLWIAPLFKWTSPKFSRWVDARGQWETDLQAFEKNSRVVWMHCASVGEFEQARPLIEGLKNGQQETQVVITFFSPSGYEVRKDYALAEVVTYLPVDLPKRINRFLELVQPDLAVFVKYEFWFNAMDGLHRRGIPMILISAHLTEKHWTLQWPGIYLGKRLQQFDCIFAQDQATVDRLMSVNIQNAMVVGDTRVDRVVKNASVPFEMDGLMDFIGNQQIIVIGSNWPSDDAVILEVLKARKDVKLIVAPHELKSEQQAAWKRSFGSDMIRVSEIDGTVDWSNAKVLYVDQIGMLSRLYRFGAVAYIGGGFGAAVHNTLEAAVYGIPVIIGPNNKRFLEVQALKELGVGVEIADKQEFEQALETALSSDSYRQKVLLRLTEYFEHQKGATDKVLTWIESRFA
ncbi:MAG: glycosyltransferase N-terminal domain-containing protein [Cryomorphaceae bacterium]